MLHTCSIHYLVVWGNRRGLTSRAVCGDHDPMLLAIVVTVAQILGILSSISALLTTRTSQGAIAWIVSLNTFPYLAVPAYWIFGRSRFNGYVTSRQEVDSRLADLVPGIRQAVAAFHHHPTIPREDLGQITAIERIAKIPFTRNNGVELLENGTQAFPRMIDEIHSAREYILIQFYTVRNDTIGTTFADALKTAAQRGVQVFFLYDEIGSYTLPGSFIREVRAAGVSMVPFSSTRGIRNRFQINFRNHRKVLVVDGRIGFLGGLNLGDEYLGESERFGPWRDTHIALRGPVLVSLQLPFVEDWHWATGTYPAVNWSRPGESPVEHGHVALVIPSGPADEWETASLLVQHAIHTARERLWIASPYFVPDEGVQDALKLAVLRGVDVRILIPDRPDHMLVFFSAFAFLKPMIRAGVHVYRYLPGFLHQKVFLVDNQAVGIGTVNLDNRSFRLNFEITAVILGERVASRVADMLLRDMDRARRMEADDISSMPLRLKIISRVAYLLAPIQ